MVREDDGAQSRKGGIEPDQRDSTRKPPETPSVESMACGATRKPENGGTPGERDASVKTGWLPGGELKDLAGEGWLDAVDMLNEAIPSEWDDEEMEDSEVCRFRLNGTVFAAIEDPSDGYRSSMRDLRVLPDAKMANTFPPVRVVGIYRDKSHYHDADIIGFYAVQNGKLVLEVGTDNSDDYYPSFVSSFRPENIPLPPEAHAMSETNWNDLARRCEEATRADREIDTDLHEALGGCAHRETEYYCIEDGNDVDSGFTCKRCGMDAYGRLNDVKPVTASLDAITALIERELPDVRWAASRERSTGGGEAVVSATYKQPHQEGSAATPALALCAAFCRAMAHLAETITTRLDIDAASLTRIEGERHE